MLQLAPGQRIHIIGIGGAGLSAIARILLERGWAVSGSDLRASPLTDSLRQAGAQLYIGHDARYVQGADMVLTTSAAPADHVEIKAAQARHIPVYKRQDFIGAMLGDYDTIAVAGTHGKTTTTSMIVHILQRAGKDPSYIVGGTMANSGRNAALGAGSAFVIEADEYDNMFLGLDPQLAVVTNVEHDHPDFFKTPAQLQAAFRQFLNTLKRQNQLIACADDDGALQLAEARQSDGSLVTTYGIHNPAADWRAADLQYRGALVTAMISSHGSPQAELTLSVPGAHNVLNALAAIAAASLRGVRPALSAKALRSFRATARRFEIRGERDGVILVDDYAHHPTEIQVNIEAARLRYPAHQIWAVWQPHTFSRVKQFWSRFISAFAGADRALITPIYAAREAPLAGITSRALAEAMSSHCRADFAPSFDDAVETLRCSVCPPAVILIFSAGDANVIADKFLAEGF